jgi:hypothetical protein
MNAITAARTDNKSDTVIPLVLLSVRRTSPSKSPLTNGQITANVKSVSIDQRLGLAAHHAIDEKSAFIAAML